MAFDLAAHIRQLRDELGWTQQELARRAHIDQGDLSRIESGSTDPRWSTVNRIINALGETLHADAAPTTLRPALTAETRAEIRRTARARGKRAHSASEQILPIKR
jgi:predicted transcriptional regulator